MTHDKIVQLHRKVLPGQTEPPQVKIGDLGFEDIAAAFNMRAWLQKACEAAGGKMTGGSFGGGVADISVELQGHEYWITIKAMKR